ncbi:MAG: peptidoglycan editing factor PgeF [Rickettsiales bacterium]|nr:peptidoglycan editing factor PgeF [Rickettsiales bacterium]
MLTSNLLTSDSGAHGFFTRAGGVSEGIYASLNCGSGSDDNPEHVKENQQRIVSALGGEALCRCYQVHSAVVETVEAPWDALPKADAMVTNKPNIVLGILTADCAPVLFADHKAGVVGAAHAGWKGAIGGVLENTITAMEALGAKRESIAAAIGPCIAQGSYEVGAEFYAQFVEQSSLYGTFFKESEKADHFLFDLEGFVGHRLAQSGLQNVDALGIDTYSDEQRFFSYRRKTHRDEPDYGRQLSAIMLKK